MKILKITGTSSEIFFVLDTGETIVGNGELLINGFAVSESSLKFKGTDVSLTAEQIEELKRIVRSDKPRNNFRVKFD